MSLRRRSSIGTPLVAALFACGMLVACQKGSSEGGATATASAPGDAVHGKQVFMTTCSTCHGTDGKGVKGLGKDLVDSEFVKTKSDADLVKMVSNGRAMNDPLNTTKIAMPPKGGNPALSDKDIRDAVAYLKTINKAS
jgi:mono/diheme cytochrome c family protein